MTIIHVRGVLVHVEIGCHSRASDRLAVASWGSVPVAHIGAIGVFLVVWRMQMFIATWAHHWHLRTVEQAIGVVVVRLILRVCWAVDHIARICWNQVTRVRHRGRLVLWHRSLWVLSGRWVQRRLVAVGVVGSCHHFMI